METPATAPYTPLEGENSAASLAKQSRSNSESSSLFGQGSFLSTCFLYISTGIGSGVLALPYTFNQGGGPIIGILAFVFAACIAMLSNYILAKATIDTGASTYGALLDWAIDLWSKSSARDYRALEVERKGATVAWFDLFMMIYQCFVVVPYHCFLADFLPAIIGISNRTAIILTVAYVFVLPLSLAKNLSFLRYVSSLSVWAIVFTAIVAIVRSFDYIPLHEEAIEASLEPSNAHLSLMSLNTVSVCVFAFFNQINAVSVASEMRNPTPSRQLFSVLVYGLFLGVSYCALACAVYWSFMEHTQADFLLNYPQDDRLIFACRVLLSVMLVVACPLNLFPSLAAFYRQARLGFEAEDQDNWWNSLWGSIHVGTEGKLGGRVVVSLCFVTGIALTAIQVPNVANFIGALSSYMSVPIMMLFPGLIYLLLWPVSGSASLWAKVKGYFVPVVMILMTLVMWVAATVNILRK